MKTLAYLRVSKDSQDVTHQRLAVLEFARHDKREIDEFMELRVSSRRSPKEQHLDVLLTRLEPGDTLIVSELSRMGRSGICRKFLCSGECLNIVAREITH